jgi:uroporphyrinogen decarboxylase
MNKRDRILHHIHSGSSDGYVPAAFFMHFDPTAHAGQAAIDKHLEFFRTTDMDFVKIQYEQTLSSSFPIRTLEDWAHLPRYTEEAFEESAHVVAGIVKAAKHDALVIMTLYSPYMWLRQCSEGIDLAEHLRENPAAVAKGLEIMTENVRTLVRACKRVGVDGFYASTQGGEAFPFPGAELFRSLIKPSDLAIWDEINDCTFNILHICDYVRGYDDLSPFLDYPGHVVNCSLHLGDRALTTTDISQVFGRPFMGGMERKGVIATGNADGVEIRQATEQALAHTPKQFILGADCTIPSDTSWENLKTVIAIAHQYGK